MKITRKVFENYLNDSYSPNIAECIYLTVKSNERKKTISKIKLQIRLDKKEYGSVLRMYDPAKFEIEFKNWAKKYN